MEGENNMVCKNNKNILKIFQKVNKYKMYTKSTYVYEYNIKLNYMLKEYDYLNYLLYINYILTYTNYILTIY